MFGFSLGGSQDQHRQQQGDQEGIPPENLFLCGGTGGRGEEIPYTRGFGLWQQHQIQRQHHLSSSSSAAAGGTLLSFSDGPGSSAGAMRSSGGGGISCQDCGNQAKKDCIHLRCRTCCKSRGFHCPTHVKSTWVPASKRRERQQQLAAAAAALQHQHHPHHYRGGGSDGSSGGGETSKRPREATRLPTAAITTTTSGGALEAASFPPEVSSQAVFRCVRVSPVDEAEDEYAYQTAVSIGGHVFKGLLYDQGLEPEYMYSTHYRSHLGEASSSPAAAISTAAAIASNAVAAANTNASDAAAALLDPYPTPLSAFMAGAQFFPQHPRP